MNRSQHPVLLLHPDLAFQERVRRACQKRYWLIEVEDWAGLRRALVDAPPLALLVVDPYDHSFGRSRLSNTLQSLLREFPSATVIAACDVRTGCLDDIRSLGEWGVSRVIGLKEEDTPLAILRVLERSHGRPLRNLLERSLPQTLSGRARAILLSAGDVVSGGGLGRDLARSLHVTPRTLQRWCRGAGIPPPRQLLAWMRLLLAAELLDDSGRSVLGVALACGYSSDGALRNAFRALLERSPRGLRDEGAFRVVSEAFLQALSVYRAPRRRAVRAVISLPERQRQLALPHIAELPRVGIAQG